MRIVVCALIVTLFVASPSARAQEFQGKVIFSVELVEWAMERGPDGSRGPRERTGIFYYYKEGPGEYGSTITGYKLLNGEIIGVAGAGSVGTAALLKKLNAMPLSAFDVQDEIDRATVSQRANNTMMIVADGAKYRIRYDFNDVGIDHTGWEPGSYIDGLAQYSENLSNLKDVIDLFATHYGRRQFGL